MGSVMLYFGSFNPIHRGHMAIAEYVLRHGLCDELWFVVSPRNPLKDDSILIGEEDRLKMVEVAIGESGESGMLRACDVEFGLPRPSYTIDTMRALNEQFPQISFSILMGSDAAAQIEMWKEWRALLSDYKIYVYPREGYDIRHSERFVMLDRAPYFDYSSTEIREALLTDGDAAAMLPTGVYDYITQHGLWK